MADGGHPIDDADEGSVRQMAVCQSRGGALDGVEPVDRRRMRWGDLAKACEPMLLANCTACRSSIRADAFTCRRCGALTDAGRRRRALFVAKVGFVAFVTALFLFVVPETRLLP